MTHYTLQVSNHAEAGLRIPTQAASESWLTIYNGPIATAAEARRATEQAAEFYRHARVFIGASVGKLHYVVFRTSP
jgi:hypothetical protein